MLCGMGAILKVSSKSTHLLSNAEVASIVHRDGLIESDSCDDVKLFVPRDIEQCAVAVLTSLSLPAFTVHVLREDAAQL